MRGLTKSKTAKIAAGIVFVITLSLSIAFTCLTGIMYSLGYYSHSRDSCTENVYHKMAENEIFETLYTESGIMAVHNGDAESLLSDGLAIVINEANGNEIEINYDSGASYEREYGPYHYNVFDDYYSDYDDGSSEYEEESASEPAELTAYVDEEAYGETIAGKNAEHLISLYDYRAIVTMSAIVGWIISLVCLVFLMMAAGKREEDDEIHPRFIDKGLIDLNFFVSAIAITLVCFVPLIAIKENWSITAAAFGAAFAVSSAIFLQLMMSWAVQIKTHVAWRKSIVGRVLIWMWKLVKRIFAWLHRIAKNVASELRNFKAEDIKKLNKTWLFIGAATLLIFFNAMVGASFGLIFVEAIVIIAIILFYNISIINLDKSVERLAKGETGNIIDLDGKFGRFKEWGKSINSIDQKIQEAVEEQMKSERLKTELITNMSHDIKTPLTSIINYAELLSRHEDEGDDEVAKEYIDVIYQNSLRLKKLTEDVIEASKASTGAIKVEHSNLNLGMLVTQALSEYEERFEARKLTQSVKIDEDIIVSADGKLMWRVLDNIFSNISKYSMEGTRVYAEVYKAEEESGEKAYAVFKNISSEELNICPEELMERFIRGDASRNTEGSGLGLSISDSLTKLQGGTMKLEIDGDLFKVTLCFELCYNC